MITKASPEISQAMETSADQAIEILKKAQLPLAARIMLWVCGIVAAITVIGILTATIGEGSVSLAAAYLNASWLFWLAGGCLIAGSS